ncbi:MKI67 FHA domain-interacting nucleolar phosphoprotein-like [Tubulanus polymorphus]|uniref:MKI67 FHA domain-interacting nucleolar phosphoprotein-like n=1 Tax=Tubulanus polymorphus TaxID=672921 RepID=UPI003DA3A5C4
MFVICYARKKKCGPCHQEALTFIMAALGKKSRGKKTVKESTSDDEMIESSIEKEKSKKWGNLIALDPKDQAEFELKVKDIRDKKNNVLEGSKKGVVYLGHIPKGLFEPQLKKFFSQFGNINRLRISRSKKTGNSKGYAFIEFEFAEIAKVVAETMNSYLTFNRLMQCQFLPDEKVHPAMFKNSFRRFKRPISHLISQQRLNKHKSQERVERNKNRFRQKTTKKLQKLSELGIEMTVDLPNCGPAISCKQVAKKKSKKESATDETEVELNDVNEDADTTLSADKTHVLLDDSSDFDITIKTPPNTVRMSRSFSHATASTPVVSQKKTQNRRKSMGAQVKTKTNPAKKKVKRLR